MSKARQLGKIGLIVGQAALYNIASKTKRMEPSYNEKNKAMNVNVSLAEKILQSGEREAFRVYLAAKTIAAGNGAWFRRRDEEFRKELMSALDIRSGRTLDKKIDRLLELGWFYKCRNNVIRIWSFSTLKDDFDVESSLCHLARIRYITSSKKRFRATLLSIVVGAVVGQRRHSLVRKATHIKGAAKRPSYTPGKGEKYSPESLSVSFLGKRLNKSKATIHRWKRLACRLGLLSRVKQEYLFEGCSNPKAIKNAFPEDAYRIQMSHKEGCVKIQMADRLASPLKYKTARQ